MLKPVINDAEPMPTKGSFRESKYQWLEEIEVGQSFDVDSDADFNRVASAARSLEFHGNLPEGYKLARRKMGSTIRIYRTA